MWDSVVQVEQGVVPGLMLLLAAPGVRYAEILGDDGAECRYEVRRCFELLFQSFAGGGSHDCHALDAGCEDAQGELHLMRGQRRLADAVHNDWKHCLSYYRQVVVVHVFCHYAERLESDCAAMHDLQQSHCRAKFDLPNILSNAKLSLRDNLLSYLLLGGVRSGDRGQQSGQQVWPAVWIVPIRNSRDTLRKASTHRRWNEIQELQQVEPNLRFFGRGDLWCFEKLFFLSPVPLDLMFQQHSS